MAKVAHIIQLLPSTRPLTGMSITITMIAPMESASWQRIAQTVLEANLVVMYVSGSANITASER